MAGLVNIDVGNVVTTVLDSASKIKTLITGKLSPEEQAQFEQHNMDIQTAINQVEAGSKSTFVAGWRPFVGWICASALLFNFILYPLLFAIFSFKSPVSESNLAELIGLLTVLLGVRSWEKVTGTQNNH